MTTDVKPGRGNCGVPLTVALEDLDNASFEEWEDLEINETHFDWEQSTDGESFAERERRFTDIARDGLLKGLNLEATIALADAISIPVIASGGLASIEDVKALLTPRAKKLEGAISGRALYDGRIDPAEALALIKNARTVV